MVIKVLNLNKCIEKFGNMEGIDFMPEITEGTRKVQRTARDLAPVYPSPKAKNKNLKRVGGTLKASIKSKLYPKQQTGIVYTLTDYAIYQEFGTRYQEGTPFLIPAMNIHRAGINQSMKKFLREQVKNKSK